MTQVSMFQAIQTKFLGPTNVKGSRVKAWAEAGSITVSWDYSLDSAGNHRAAAEKLAAKSGWVGEHYGEMVGGSLPGNSGYAFVFNRGGQ